MTRHMLFALSFCFAAASQAACTPDTVEIGDTGPDSSQICQKLQQRYPDAQLEILDRQIHTAESVSIVVSVDGEIQPLGYRLVGADWVLTKSQIARNR